ncbi:MAG TPA: DNA repair protein RecN [Candidatus Rifleibacterium sp.]|nr:DNA repair protein RecN [Candidatus Rifleibacterium sp.]HPW58078.1 DNA repair protein RecN [Candidatus Rifleibacterium sp.]
MIQTITLENFLFMHRAELEFSAGLNVITGETGAGKSVLLEAVKLLLGKKARAGLVLPGQTQAKVQAEFCIAGQKELALFLEESGFGNEESPETLTITRTFKDEGSGRVLVNGILSNAAFLKQLGNHLMEIHGQNEHQTLLLPEIQKEMLDRTGNHSHKSNLAGLRQVFKDRQKLADKLLELENRNQQSATRVNELQAAIQELTALNLTNPDEEDQLKEDLKRLSHSEQIINCLQTAVGLLSGTDEGVGATMQSYRISEQLKKISGYDTRLEESFQRANNLYFELKALEKDLEAMAESTDLDPERLQQVQERLMAFSKACRKHATDFRGLFALKESISQELEELMTPDQTRDRLKKEYDAVDRQFKDLTTRISKERQKLAETLNKKVSQEMAGLGFNAAVFKAELSPVNPAATGAENIEFCVSLNPGAPGGPLRKIASGGELSRVALAIKKVLASCDALPTLVFDEIDAGIGGKTAEAVAESLRSLGSEKQVLLVTHLHQIAKEGSHHFTVTKTVDSGATIVNIRRVKDSERVEEIARMLGQTDNQGLEFARNLLAKSSGQS